MSTTHRQQQPTDMWADEREQPRLLALYAAIFLAALGLSALFRDGWFR